MKRILLVRHGSTDWVENHIIHGISDIPLNKNGVRQAHEAAKALSTSHAKTLYTSPLIRCQQTAEIIGNNVNLLAIKKNGFKEMNFGWLEGHPYRDYVTTSNYSSFVKFYDQSIHSLFRLISGESTWDFRRKVLAEWETIIQSDNESPIIIVAHSLVFNKILIHHFGKEITNGHDYYPLSPGSITELIITDNGITELIRLDDRSHLS